MNLALNKLKAAGECARVRARFRNGESVLLFARLLVVVISCVCVVYCAHSAFCSASESAALQSTASREVHCGRRHFGGNEPSLQNAHSTRERSRRTERAASAHTRAVAVNGDGDGDDRPTMPPVSPRPVPPTAFLPLTTTRHFHSRLQIRHGAYTLVHRKQTIPSRSAH